MFFELPPRHRLTFLYKSAYLFQTLRSQEKGTISFSTVDGITRVIKADGLLQYFYKTKVFTETFFSHGTRNKYNAFVNACLNASSYKPGPGYMELPYMQRKQYENRSELKFQTSFCLYSDLTSHGITAHYITLHHIRSHFISIIIIVIEQLLKHDF